MYFIALEKRLRSVQFTCHYKILLFLIKNQMQSGPPEETLQEAYTNRRKNIPKTQAQKGPGV